MRRRTYPQPFFFVTVLFAVLAAMILIFPGHGMESALRGISIWWDVLFPALFPFLVLSELMLGFGIVHFFGTLLDPLMRPLFRVPGIGGFVMAMGFASGYPVGAKLTSQLWEQKLVNQAEGERLVAFTTTSDPIFLIGAVSVGFFGNPGLAVILAAAHYGGALIVGVLMRFHAKGAPKTPSSANIQGSLLIRSFQNMHTARLQDGRPFGTMLQQAIRSSIQLIFVIGGLVVFFSVVMDMLTLANLMAAAHTIVGGILNLFGFPAPLAEAVINGIFEVTLGAKSAGAGNAIPLIYQTAVCAVVLSWAGLSVHAQIVSILHHTGFRYRPFLFARMIHGLLSGGLVLLLWNPLQPVKEQADAAFAALADWDTKTAIWGLSLPISLLLVFFLALAFAILSALYYNFKRMNEPHDQIR